MLKKIMIGFGVILLLLAIVALFNLNRIKRLNRAIHLFDEDKIVNNFLHLEDYIPTRTIERSNQAQGLQKGPSYQLPLTFTWKDQTENVQYYLDHVNTTSMIVIQNDSIIYEEYGQGMKASDSHISWSVAKSFVSALLGIALEEKLFDSIEDPIDKYLPQFKGSAYDQVRIKDILQMSTGVGFNEDYRDFNSDINRFGRHFALGKSFEKFALGLKRVREPGSYHHYVSLNTQVLGMLVEKVSGKRLSVYLKEKLWDPMGMQDDAQWIIDNTGMEMALGGLNVSPRDYAKFGLLYLREGDWFGQQLVPKSWVQQSIQMDAPHLQPGEHGLSHDHFGYGFQWWIPRHPEGDYFACGIYSQFIYIQPAKNLVILKTSANHTFRNPGDDSKDKHVSLFQQMARGL